MIKEIISHKDGTETVIEYTTKEFAELEIKQAQMEKEARMKEINIRFEEIDKQCCQARVIEDLYNGKGLSDRVKALLEERTTLVLEKNNLETT